MASSPITAAVRCDIDSRGVATVTLDRLSKHNAFDDSIIAELSRHFDDLGRDNQVRVVVLAAEGRSFSAGGDLAWMQRMADFDHAHNVEDARALANMLQALKTLPQPTIARVQGAAFGGAVGLIACCDIAIAVASARFGLTETRIGLIPATIGPHVIEALGPRWARRLFLTAERFDATLAQEIGLVHELCPPEDLDIRIEACLADLLANSPRALRAAKQLCADLLYKSVDEGVLSDTSERIADLRVSTEGQEGLRSFLEKRSPAWTDGDPA